MKKIFFSLLMAFAIFFSNVGTAEADTWCDALNGTIYVETFNFNDCLVTVHYCFTTINGPGEVGFKILNIYVHHPCVSSPVVSNRNLINFINSQIIQVHYNNGIPPCSPEHNGGTVFTTQSDQCYRYEKRGYPNYNYNHVGGYSIVPCGTEGKCSMWYLVCYRYSAVGGNPEVEIICNAEENIYSEDCATNPAGILQAFLANPNIIESECIIMACNCDD